VSEGAWVDVAPGVALLGLRTPTLPPATHTNAVILGRAATTVVDPASPWDDEQGRLLDALAGRALDRIVLTHHHHDHVAGAVALAEAWVERGHRRPSIVAHATTAERLQGRLTVDALLAPGDVIDVEGDAWTVQHTPGHAPGHVVLERADGIVVAGDMVAGVGTILIDPEDGDLGDYLDSLAKMQARGPERLIPSHGPVLEHAEAVLAFYIAHRHQRTAQIAEALRQLGEVDVLALVGRVYAQVDPAVWPIAAVQLLAHLRWMERHGMARQSEAGAWVSR
jgi:glyoxylase-like metal-dependent hydrolase (beta-lactamase superfamily II)